MRLKYKFLHQELCGVRMAVAADFNGIVRNNETADFIFRLLDQDRTEEEIIDLLEKEYDAPRDVIAVDTSRIINRMRELELIEE